MCWCLVRLFTCVFSFRTFHMRFLYPADPRPCFPYSSCNDGIWIEIDCWRTQSTGKVDRDGYWERIQPIYLSFLIVPSDNLTIQWENTSIVFVILKNTFKDCRKLIISAFVSGAKIIKYFPIHFAKWKMWHDTLRIQLQLNTALLSTVRPFVCHRRDISHFSHI